MPLVLQGAEAAGERNPRMDSGPVGGSGDVVPSVHEVLREARFC